MVRIPGCVVLMLLVVASTATAQHEHSPYAAMANSEIASLSQDESAQLQSGAGMALARAAELNHYPGPLHVLELADSLELTADQHTRVTAIREEMLERAIALGEKIIEAERTLSQRFEHAHVDSATVLTSTTSIGYLYGELRYVHLAAHLAVRHVLTEEQVAAYERLRGYVAPM